MCDAIYCFVGYQEDLIYFSFDGFVFQWYYIFLFGTFRDYSLFLALGMSHEEIQLINCDKHQF